jgi:D-alanyl-D-alanine carboxypeptidase
LSTASFQRTDLGMQTSDIAGFVTQLKDLGVSRIDGHVVADASWFDARQAVTDWTSGVRSSCGPLGALTLNEGLNDGHAVADPAEYTARVLTKRLRAAGIAVTGGPLTGVTPQGAYCAVTLLSAPLSDLLTHMDKESDNFFAEMLLKGLGRDLYGEGTTDAGLQALRGALTQSGAAPGSYRIADGSGLSYEDRLTAGDLVKLLVAMYRSDDFDTFYDALSVAGVDGTLEDRMRGTAAQGDAHAKTGTLDVAAALSGYVTSADGHLLAFSILVNGDPVDDWHAMQAQDAIVAALAASRIGGGLRLAPGAGQHVQGAADPTPVPARALVPCPEVPAA